jgi:hypothetical protein
MQTGTSERFLQVAMLTWRGVLPDLAQVMYTVVEDAPVYHRNMHSHQRIFDAMLAQVRAPARIKPLFLHVAGMARYRSAVITGLFLAPVRLGLADGQKHAGRHA